VARRGSAAPAAPTTGGSAAFDLGEPGRRRNNGAVQILQVLTPRRLVTTAVILLAAVLAIVGLQSVRDQRNASCGAGASGASPIKVLYPCPGDDGLRQGRIGVSLADGYTADLSVDGTVIPKDQMIIEGSDFFFIPGPNTQIGALAPGPHVARIVFYRLLEDPNQGTAYTWSFSTH
jgi:hypothetical protein